MSRRQSKPHIPAAAIENKSLSQAVVFILQIGVAVILAGIPFAMGKYFEFAQPDAYDGGAFVYSAQKILAGAELMKDEIPSANPGTLLVNYIGVALFGFSELGAEIIQTLMQLAAMAMLFYTLRRFFCPTAAIISTAVASIYLSAPVIAKVGNVKEQYMIAMMVISACCFILSQVEGKRQTLWLAATGAAGILPYYFKPTGLSIVAAIGVYLLGRLLFKQISVRQMANDTLTLAVGGIIGILPLLVFFACLKYPSGILRSFGFLFIQTLFLIVATYWLVSLVNTGWRHGNIGSKIRSISRRWWIALAAAVLIGYAVGIIMVRQTDGYLAGDTVGYLYSTPLIHYPLNLVNQCDVFAGRLIQSLGLQGGYIVWAKKSYSLSKQAPIVFRYYGVVILPILLAALSLLTAAGRLILKRLKKPITWTVQDNAAWFLAVWWLCDMAFAWVSPRSYEQYYLPLCASGAALGGYAVWRFMSRWNSVVNPAGIAMAAAALMGMTGLVWPIFAGITHSPFSGSKYPARSRGYAQSLTDTKARLQGLRTGDWEQIGDYIRQHSTPDDAIFVWGWFPGIYVRAQRLSSAPKAFEGNMHVMPPEVLAKDVEVLLYAFSKRPPKFIVDSRKWEFPYYNPPCPLELWPQTPKEFGSPQRLNFLSTQPQIVVQYEAGYGGFLKQRIGEDEARRFAAFKPMRDYVMQNYQIVGTYGNMVLFERKAQTNPR